MSQLPKVETVLIGDSSFRKKNWHCVESKHLLLLNYCPFLREFRLGAWSFSDIGRCDVDKDSTMIEVNSVDNVSDPFKDAVLKPEGLTVRVVL